MEAAALLLLLPLVAFAALILAGAGLATLLGRTFPADAQAALAPVCGAALFAAASPAVAYGVSVRTFGLCVLTAGAAVSLAQPRRLLSALRAGAVPLAAATVSFALVAAPSLSRESWRVTSLGNIDVYFWTSQARAFLDGPAPVPASFHPDRIAFERVADQGWAVALPVGNALLSIVDGKPPMQTYGALVALLALLLPLATYACARACLAWSRGRSVAAAVIVGANAAFVHAGYFGWHGQMLGLAFLVSAAFLFRLVLETNDRRLQVATALMVAAALGSYRLPIAPVLAVVLTAVAAAYALVSRTPALRVLRVAAATAMWSAVLAAGSLVPLVLGLPRFLSNELVAAKPITRAPFAEGLGLVPMRFAPGGGASAAVRLIALATVGVLLAYGFSAARRRMARGDFLLGTAGVVAAGALLLVPLPFDPYVSLKLVGYGLPFLTLTALAALAGDRRPQVRAVAAGTLVFAVLATVSFVGEGVRTVRKPPAFAGLSDAVALLPAEAIVSVDVSDTWTQVWAVHELREALVSVREPSIVLVGIGSRRSPTAFRHDADYVLQLERPANGTLWRGDGLELRRIQ